MAKKKTKKIYKDGAEHTTKELTTLHASVDRLLKGKKRNKGFVLVCEIKGTKLQTCGGLSQVSKAQVISMIGNALDMSMMDLAIMCAQIENVQKKK